MQLGVAGGGNALAMRSSYTSMLPGIRVPALVVEGQNDSIYPLPIAQALVTAIPRSTLAVIPGAAHASMLRALRAMNTAIENWLGSIK